MHANYASPKFPRLCFVKFPVLSRATVHVYALSRLVVQFPHVNRKILQDAVLIVYNFAAFVAIILPVVGTTVDGSAGVCVCKPGTFIGDCQSETTEMSLATRKTNCCF